MFYILNWFGCIHQKSHSNIFYFFCIYLIAYVVLFCLLIANLLIVFIVRRKYSDMNVVQLKSLMCYFPCVPNWCS